MTYLKIRNTFSIRVRSGSRTKYLNKRTHLSNKTKQPPLLIVDLDYILLILNKKRIPDTQYYETITKILPGIFSTVLPKGILFVSRDVIPALEDKFSILHGNISDVVFTIKTNNLVQDTISILSNEITLWSLSSDTANLVFLLLDSSYKLMAYNNKTGLDILSKMIGTYKIINKLRLNKIKYMSLQYLFILLHYIKVTNNAPDFHFDGTFFKSRKIKTPFLRSKGLGLSLLSEAHKFLSYSFLTKPEFLDYFLLGNSDHYYLQLSRLTKLLPMDIKILLLLKQQYDTLAKPKIIPDLCLPELQCNISNTLILYYNIWTGFNTSACFTEHKTFAKLLRKYARTFSEFDYSNLVETLPLGLRKDFAKKPSRILSESVDTSKDNIVMTYVTNLINGAF